MTTQRVSQCAAEFDGNPEDFELRQKAWRRPAASRGASSGTAVSRRERIWRAEIEDVPQGSPACRRKRWRGVADCAGARRLGADRSPEEVTERNNLRVSFFFHPEPCRAGVGLRGFAGMAGCWFGSYCGLQRCTSRPLGESRGFIRAGAARLGSFSRRLCRLPYQEENEPLRGRWRQRLCPWSVGLDDWFKSASTSLPK